jgi:hypothetical protein
VEPIFALGSLPGPSQAARGAVFRPSLVSPALDPQFDPGKLPKLTFFKGARTLKIALAPRRECNFHIFTSFLPDPKIIDFGSSLGSLLEAFWLPFGLLRALWVPFGRPRALFFVIIFQSFLGCNFKANLCQNWVENGSDRLGAFL